MGSYAIQEAMHGVNKALHDIYELRSQDGADPERVTQLEESLRAAYAELADVANSRVENWQPSSAEA